MKASSVNKYRFISSVIVFSLILAFGIAFLASFLILNKDVPEDYIRTEGIITRIEEELLPGYDSTDGIGPEDYNHSVFISYSSGGRDFTDCEYPGYDSSMKEGGKVILYVNPGDPSDFMADPSGDFVFVIVGIVVILIGAGGLFCNIYKKKKEA